MPEIAYSIVRCFAYSQCDPKNCGNVYNNMAGLSVYRCVCVNFEAGSTCTSIAISFDVLPTSILMQYVPVFATVFVIAR